jgi:magnesium transporter
MVVDALDRGDAERLRELLDALHPADIADLMGFLSADYREELVPHLDPETTWPRSSPSSTPRSARTCWSRSARRPWPRPWARWSPTTPPTSSTTWRTTSAPVLAAMPDVERAAIETSLAYEDETAGRLMQREVVAAPQFWTVGQTIDHLRRRRRPAGAVLRRLCGRPGLQAGRRGRSASCCGPSATRAAGPDHGAGDRDPGRHGPGRGRLHLRQVPPDLRPGGGAGRAAGGPDHRRRHRRGHPGREPRRTSWPWPACPTPGRDAGVFGIVRSRLPWLVLNLGTEAIAVQRRSAPSRARSPSW